MKLSEYLDLTEIKELKRNRLDKLKKKIDDIFYSNDAETAGDWVDEVDKNIDIIIKELEDISKTSKVEFGNEKSQLLGKAVGSMRDIQKSIKQFSRALDGFYSRRNALKNL